MFICTYVRVYACTYHRYHLLQHNLVTKILSLENILVEKKVLFFCICNKKILLTKTSQIPAEGRENFFLMLLVLIPAEGPKNFVF